MTYFLLSITNACNKSCDYCVVRPWLNSPDYPDKATAQDFIDFLAKEMQPGDVVELTGGEPTMFPGLFKILDFLKENGTKVILRTNGFKLGKWRKNFENAVVVLARHDSCDEYMSERKKHLLPQDLVLDGIPDDIKQKEQDKPIFKADAVSPETSHPFKRMFHITNDGKIRFMSCCKDDMGTLWDYRLRTYHCCYTCPYALGAWNLARRMRIWSR